MIEGPDKVTLTAPERIWLCVSADACDREEVFPADHEGVTWSDDEPVDCTVAYVRQDKAEQVQQELDIVRSLHKVAVRERDMERLLCRQADALSGALREAKTWICGIESADDQAALDALERRINAALKEQTEPDPLAQPGTVTSTIVHLPDDLYTPLWRMAQRKDKSVSEIVIEQLRGWVERQELTRAELIRLQLEERRARNDPDRICGGPRVAPGSADYGTLDQPACLLPGDPGYPGAKARQTAQEGVESSGTGRE